MRNTLAFILSIILAVSLVALAFTVYQIKKERTVLNTEFEARVSAMAGEISSFLTTTSDTIGPGVLEKLTGQIKAESGFMGLAYYNDRDSLLFNNSPDDLLNYSEASVKEAVEMDSSFGVFLNISGYNLYQFITPVRKGDSIQGALILYTDTGYIESTIRQIWFRNFIRWFLQTLLIGFGTFALIRWGIFKPMKRIVNWMRALRAGETGPDSPPPNLGFLNPLHKEIESIAVEMRIARASAEEEARLRATAEAIWTPERLKAEMVTLLRSKKLVKVKLSQPFRHSTFGL